MRIRKKPRKPKNAMNILKRKAWTLFSRYIRTRDGFKCITCGKIDQSPRMHAGHFLHRSIASSLIFDERNVHAQCAYCNTYKETGGVYAAKIIEKYGIEVFNELQKKRTEYHKWTEKELQAIVDKYASPTSGNTDSN